MKQRTLDVYITVTLDQPTAEKLDAMARQQTDGNRSMIVRQLIRNAPEPSSNGTCQDQAQA